MHLSILFVELVGRVGVMRAIRLTWMSLASEHQRILVLDSIYLKPELSSTELMDV